MRGFEIRAHDCKMNVFKCGDRFQLDDNGTLNKKVQSMFANVMFAIKNGQGLLSLESNFLRGKFKRERCFINRFKKPGAKFTMNTNRSTDDFFSQIGVLQFP